MSQAHARRSGDRSLFQPADDSSQASARGTKPGGRTLTEAFAVPAAAEPAPADDAIRRAHRTLQLLAEQATRLEQAIAARDFFAARSAAETLSSLQPGLHGSVAAARRDHAAAAEVTAVEARAQELAPRLEALIAQAPPSEPGLGLDLIDPSANLARQAAWQEALGARTAPGATSTPASAATPAPATRLLSTGRSSAAAQSAAAQSATAASATASSAAASSATAQSAAASSATAPSPTASSPTAPSPTASSAPPATAPSHEGFEAAADHRISQAVLAGRTLAAPAYLHFHMIELRPELGAYLAAHLRATGDPQVAFAESPGHFVTELLRPLRPDDASACITTLQAWLAPLDLFAIVDRNRAIFERPDPRARDAARVDYDHGPKGPASWSPAVAAAIGAALQARLVESLARMSPRLVAATAARREPGAQASAPEASDRPATRARDDVDAGAARITTRDLVPSSPLDAHVARAFVGHGGVATVEVAAGALHVQADARVRHRAVKALRWQGELGGPWNAVQAVSPADAGPEELAQALFGSWAQADRLVRIGSTYLVPEADAARYPEAVRHRPAGPRSGSAEHALIFGPGAGAAITAETERQLAHTPGRPGAPTPASLVQQWTRIDDQLHGLLLVVGPLGVATELAAAYVLHAQRRVDLEALTGRDAELRGASFAQQEALLTELAAEIAALLAQLGGKAGKGSPLHTALRALVLAASRSHLAETGRRLQAEARAAQRAVIFETLEALVGQLESRLEQIHQLADHTRGRSNYSALLLGKTVTARRQEALLELATLRGEAIATGQVDPDRLDRLFKRLDRLRFEAELIANVGALGQMFQVFDQLERDRWTLFSEAVTETPSEGLAAQRHGAGRLEVVRRGAFELQSVLATAHSRWLKVEQRAQGIEATAAAGPGAAGATRTAGAAGAAGGQTDAIEAELAAIRRQLADVGSSDKVQAFLTHASQTAHDAQTRALITQLVVLLGVTVASGGAAALAEGVATGLGASALGAQLVGLAVETSTFSALSACLSGDSLTHELLHNFAGNLATFGALRLTRAGLAGSKLGQIIRAGRSAGRGASWAARIGQLGEVTATTIVAVGVQYAQAQVTSLAQRGRGLSSEELHAAATQGMAMMIGGAILHHGLTAAVDDARLLGADAAAHHAQRQRLDRLAHQLAEHGDPALALELLHDLRDQLTAEHARWKKLQELAPGQLAARGLSPAMVEQMSTSTGAHLGELDKLGAGSLPAQLGLRTAVPGHVYVGEPAAIARVLEVYRDQGYAVEVDGPLTIVTRPGDPGGPGRPARAAQPPLHLIERAAPQAQAQAPGGGIEPLAAELHALLDRDPEAFVTRYRRATRTLPTETVEALRQAIRDRRVAPASAPELASLDRAQLIALHTRRMQALLAIGETDRMAFHGTNSDMLAGLAETGGQILPAAELQRRGVPPATGEGPKFSVAGHAKEFVSIGQGRSGLGTSLAYSDASGTMEHYNPKVLSYQRLLAEVAELRHIVDHFEAISIEVEGPLKLLGIREKAHFEAELSKLTAELSRRDALPPELREPHPGQDNYPVLFEVDLAGLDDHIDVRTDVRAGQALGGEASLFAGINLKKRLRRVYVPAANLQDVTTKLTRILGHDQFEVLALEAVDHLPNPGEIASSRVATRSGLAEMEKTVACIQRAYARALRERRPLNAKLIVEELTAHE